MPTTMNEVRAFLEAEEVDYAGASKLGVTAVPFLLQLVQGGDLNLASKAAYLASLIKGERAAAVIETAAKSSEPVVRAAVASGLRNLPEAQASRVLARLGQDPDASIRKVTLQSAQRLRSPRIAAKLQQLARKDPEPAIRALAAAVPTPTRRRKAK